MGGATKNTPLADALKALRQDNYEGAKATVPHALGLEQNLDIFQLKAFLIKATKDRWSETKESDMILMALGLLDGYYYNTKYLENINPSEIAKIGERRDKYLRYGPYVRTKDGRRYASYDAIEEDEEKADIKNALGQQDGRLLDKLAGFIDEIEDVKQYIKNAEADPRYTVRKQTKSGRRKRLIRLPKQCSFLEDFPEPSECSPPEKTPAAKASHSDFPPVEELFPTGKEIILIPGEIFELRVAILPRKAVDAPLSFVGLDPSIVTVSTSGMLKAEKKPQKLLHNIKNSQSLSALLDCAEKIDVDSQTVEIVIQAESGVTASKLVVVDYTRGCYEPPVSDINDYVPNFRVSQKVRLAGDTAWYNYVDAKIGDRLEFQTQYFNTDFFGNTHENVAMRAILPSNLRYVQGSTLLFTTATPNGLKRDDGIAGSGIYIGTYGKNSNAYVRFTAEVVDENLACDTTGLVNWVQACVNGVTLQDFTTVRVSKE